MPGSLFDRLRQFSRRQRQRYQLARLSRADAAALAHQAPPDPARLLVVRNDSIGDYLLYRPWLRQLSEAARSRGQRLTLVANSLWAPLARAWDADLEADVYAVDFGRFTTDLGYRAGMLRELGGNGLRRGALPGARAGGGSGEFCSLFAGPGAPGQRGRAPHRPLVRGLDAGYSGLLPATRAVLFEYDRNREFFKGWLAATAALPPPFILDAPLALPATVAAAGAAEAAAGPYVVLFPGPARRRSAGPRGISRSWRGGCTSATAAATGWCWPAARPTNPTPNAL